MPRQDEITKQNVIAEISGKAAASFPDAATAMRFTDAVLLHAATAEVQRHSTSDLAVAMGQMWQHAQSRAAGQPKIRVTEDNRAIQIVNDDMRFLVDSTTAALTSLGVVLDLVLHPVIAVRRDAGGHMVEFGGGGLPESMMHLILAEELPPDRHDAIIARLGAVLAEIRAAIADWPAMRAQAADLAEKLRNAPDNALRAGAIEDSEFLAWLDRDNFLFLGTRAYNFAGADLAVVPNEGLGLLRHDDYLVFDGLRALTRVSGDVQAFLSGPQPVMVSKSNRRSPIHRPVLMDTILVKLFDAGGIVTGLRLLLGLFTLDSAHRLPHEVPILRQKIGAVQARSGFAPNSRDARALQHILDTFPRDELFQIDEDQLFDTAIGVLHLEQRPALALFVLRDPFARFATCLVYLPRDRFNAEVARRIGAILVQEFAGQISIETTQFTSAALVRLHFVITTPSGITGAIDVADIRRRLTEALRTWSDRLSEALSGLHGAQAAQALMRRYARAFPPSYQDRSDAAAATLDMQHIDTVLAGRPIEVALRPLASGTLSLRIYRAERPVPLSDVLPVLENLGLRVITELPFEVAPRDAEQTVWVQELELHASAADLPDDAASRFEDAFRQIWAGTLESDGFNRLVLKAGLSARQVVVLRTYAKLLRQAGSLFSQAYMEDVISTHPNVAADLVALFEQRTNPALAPEDRVTLGAATHARIIEALDLVDNLDEDRILRSFLLLILKTLRTNYYQHTADGLPKAYLSLKLASREIDLLPQPRPLVEIFVASPRMEGCHLRGGRVARGGIRWSDRREDFRTEVLGLMKAQMVKNAVIVPIGSKGGFVVKNPPTSGGREAFMAEGIACYRILMNGLLDLTDNIVGDGVVPPADVVCHDEPDTYLVVAADKGTATFSDIANSVSIERGFWLGDAFASGGSVGYDHKVMGITAKGAWEAVKRHFREIGTNIQTTDFTCVGVGDMSGDVFGNGMLLSRHIKLIAAFNHMHIFLDPAPDPERSWQERSRLFQLPRSGWSDYDASVISPGGGVFERRAKSIPLSLQVRALFGIPEESIAPAALIQILLRHASDLLWFGGIGTYIKASTETNADAGDRANDALRINANTLRARVVGEGANLAVTQRARIEFALQGGRINTDAIDNSAGVDTSDHEVNIKIAVGDVIAAGHVAQTDRVTFLASMTQDVEQHVLVDNYLQTLALSLAEASAASLLDSHAGLMRALERSVRLDRVVEFLPDDEALAQRAAARRGLTRPEIAVLLAYAKNGLYATLLATALPDVPELQSELLGYFPKRLRELSPETLVRHRLRREIIATVVANELLNRMGPSYVEDTHSRTGRDAEAIARGFLIVRDVFGLNAIWHDIEALDNLVPATAQTRLLQAIMAIVEQAVRWLLLSGLALEPAACVARFKPGVAKLTEALDEILPERERHVNESRLTALTDAGVPADLAQRVVVLNTLSTAMDIVEIAHSLGHDVVQTGRTHLAVGVDLGLLMLRRQARAMPTTTQWQRLAADALTDDSYVQQREITKFLVKSGKSVPQAEPGSELAEVMADIGRTTPPDLAMLTVASQRIRKARHGLGA
jgi:glutamate dehydrogenase